MARVFAVINQKGGVGKTTTTANVGHALARDGLNTAVVDLDPQGQLSACLGLHQPRSGGVDHVLQGSATFLEAATEVRPNLLLLPAGSSLGDLERSEGGVERAYLLRNALRDCAEGLDCVVLDCPPSAGLLTINAVAGADDVLIPMAGDYLSLTGLARLMVDLKRLQALRESSLRSWIFFNRFVPRRRLAQEVYDKVARHFPHNLLETTINEAAVLAECAGAGKTIFEYSAKSRSAYAFRALTDDLRNGRVVGNEKETTSHVA